MAGTPHSHYRAAYPEALFRPPQQHLLPTTQSDRIYEEYDPLAPLLGRSNSLRMSPATSSTAPSYERAVGFLLFGVFCVLLWMVEGMCVARVMYLGSVLMVCALEKKIALPPDSELAV